MVSTKPFITANVNSYCNQAKTPDMKGTISVKGFCF